MSNEPTPSTNSLAAIAPEVITLRIVNIRGQRVILDADLAALYGVPTKRFNEAVKRNLARFPEDFMFQLNTDEFDALRSQFATSNVGRGGRRYAPRVFNEHGALMAATVLNSPRAVQISVHIVRAFVKLREFVTSHQDLAKRLDELEATTQHQAFKNDAFANTTRKQLKDIFEALRQLTVPPDPPKRPIGFVTDQSKK